MRTQEQDLHLERIALGEEQGSGSEQEREALRVLADSNQEILEALPVEDVVREVERRRRVRGIAQEPERQTLVWALAGSALAAALILFLVLRPSDTAKPEQVAMHQGDPYDEPGDIRSKGDPRLLIHLQTTEGPVELEHQGEVAPGDLLQLSYLAAQERFGVVFSVDGRGAITQHFPETGNKAAALQQEGKGTLPSSYQLDDAPEFERFYFVSAQEAFDVELVRSALEARSNENGHKLGLNDSFHQVIFHLRKIQP